MLSAAVVIGALRVNFPFGTNGKGIKVQSESLSYASLLETAFYMGTTV